LFEIHQHWTQWLELQEVGIDAARRAGSVVGQGRNYLALGDAQWIMQQRDEALVSYATALRMGRESKNGWVEGFSLRQTGVVLSELDRVSEALPSLHAARKVFARIGERRGEVMTLISLAAADRLVGKLDTALSYAKDAVRIVVTINDAWTTAWVRCTLGQALLDTRQPVEAAEQYGQAYDLFKAFGDKKNQGLALLGLGIAAQRLGRAEEALDLLHQVNDIVIELHDETLVAEIRKMMEQLEM
jgi:tetratricopeptide (TPR) repeat protein